MHRLSSRITALLIALLLGFTPLQSVMADIALPLTAIDDSMQSMMHMARAGHSMTANTNQKMDHSGTTNQGGHAMPGCSDCQSGTCCAEQSCPTTHCASCVIAIPSAFTISSPLRVAKPVLNTGITVASGIPLSLYRPPRA